MAVSQQQVEALRRILDDSDKVKFDDVTLVAILEGVEGDQDSALAEAWGVLASRYALLVDTSESGSSRKLSDIHAHALAMRKVYQDRVDAKITAAVVGNTRTRIGKIVRP